jgi:SAM-dependent methyltransferase
VNVSCTLCRGDSPLYFRSKDYNRHVSGVTFSHYRCSQCRLIFISPVPGNLGDYYPDTYHFVPESQAYLEAGSVPERYKIEMVQRYCRKGRLLEIGPSYGSFTYLAKKAGFVVEAIEMSAKCCKFLNEVVGVHAICSDNPVEALRQTDPYDVIALWHVIEHLPDPWITLNAICARLRPGGIVVLAAPNPDAFQFRIMGRYWPHVDAPRHLMLIPMRLLGEKLEGLGMTQELMTTTDAGSVGWNTFGWEFFFGNWTSNARAKRILHRFGRAVGRLLDPIEKREGIGSAYTLIFRKGA